MEPSNESAPASQNDNLHQVKFDGSWQDLTMLMLKNIVLTIITFGFYSFWGRTATRKYLWSHVSLGGHRLTYTGTAMELLIGWCKFVGVYVLLAGANVFISGFGTVAQKGASLLFAFALMGLIPFAIYLSRNYRFNRTLLRGIRFGMDKEVGGFVREYPIAYLMMGLTLGVYTPWGKNNLHSYLKNHSMYGNQHFRYDGKGGDVAGQFFLALLLVPLTLGLYYPFYYAAIARYRAEHTYFGQAQMKLNLTGGQVFKTAFLSLLVVVVTLGFGTPWAICQMVGLICDNTSLIGPIDFATISQHAKSGTGFGEELGSGLDVDIGM